MKGPSSGNVNQKMKSVDSLIGVPALDIDNETELIQEEILSPRSSLRELQRQSKVGVQFSDWLETINQVAAQQAPDQSKLIVRTEGITPLPILFSPESEDDGINVNENVAITLVKIELCNIQTELDFWNSDM